MTLFETICGIIAALTGTGVLVAFGRSTTPIRRVLRDDASKVAALENGPAKIAGKLSTRQPIVGLDGTPAVAVWREVSCRHGSEGEGDRGPTTFHPECAEIEVTDETGTCVLEMGAALLVGPSNSYTFTPAALAERSPALSAAVTASNRWLDVVEIFIDETLVPDGSNGVVAGRASLDDAGVHAGEYRGGHRRVRLSGDDEQPLILSAWGEKPLLRHLGGPLLGLAWIGVLLWILALVTVALPYLLSRGALL